MADPALQALLDPDGMNTGIRLQRRIDSSTFTDYYVVSNGGAFPGKSLWVRVTTADSDAQKNTAIRAALSV